LPASGWQAGKPDAVFTMQQPFSLHADGRDVFQCFVIPLGFAEDRYVKTVEFRPGNARVVHHALFYLDESGAAKKLDAATSEPGYPCFGGPQFLPAGSLGGWAPGATPRPLPSGVVHTAPKGADLVIQVHYHPSGKPETDQSSIGLTFGGPPKKGLAGMVAGTRQIDLAPGNPHQEVTDTIVTPESVDLIGITPHAHLLCKEMKVDATLPDGTRAPLIWIKDWDFNWQGQYRYADPVRLPMGTKITMRYVYDNSSANPRNPSNPPKRVTFGEQTTDEMALLFLQVVLPRPEDAPQFRREFWTSRMDLAAAGPSPLPQAGRSGGFGGGERLKENSEALKRYSYQRRTEVKTKGQTVGTKVDLVRYVNGKMEVIPMQGSRPGGGASDGQSGPGRGLRGRLAAKKKEEMKENLEQFGSLLHSYTDLQSGSVRGALAKGTLSRTGPGTDGDVRVAANGVVQPSDSLTLIWSTAKRRPVSIQINTEFDGKAATVSVEYAELPNGLFYPAHTVATAVKNDITITVDTFNYSEAK
jgi:hypothetical protein